MEYKTVQLQLTSPKENITDLMNLLAIVSFKANVPKHVVMMNMGLVLDEQYVQSILSSQVKEREPMNKPLELS